MKHPSAISVRFLFVITTMLFLPSSALSSCNSEKASGESLRLVHTIKLKHVHGRLDHFAIDTARHRLFLAALGNNSVEVIDLNTDSIRSSISNLPEPQGVAFDDIDRRLFVACGGNGRCIVYSGDNFSPLKSFDLHDDADNIRFDTLEVTIFVGAANGILSSIDASAMTFVRSAVLGGHPEAFEIEREGTRVFVNVPETGSVVVYDRNDGTTKKWSLGGSGRNYPMALDETGHRLFVGCRSPAELLVLDTRNGSITQKIPISGDADDIFLDPKKKRIYVSCGEGYINIIEQQQNDQFVLREKIPTSEGARTSLFVASLGKLFVGCPKHGDRDAEIRVYEVIQ